MSMPLVTLEEAKLWLRADDDEGQEDALIQTLIGAAEQYLLDATGREWPSEHKTAKLLALVLVSEFYHNRELMLQPPEQMQIRPIVRSLIVQLQYAPDADDEDNEG